MRWIASSWAGAGLAFVLSAGVSAGQTQGNCTFTNSQGVVETLPECGGPPPAKSPADAAKKPATAFPYPGSGGVDGGQPAPGAAAPAVKAIPYPGDAPSAPTPAAGTAPEAPAAPETGAPAAPGAADVNPGGMQDAGSSGDATGSSSSSSSSSSSDTGGEAPATDAEDAAASAHRRRKLPVPPRQTPTEREVEDLKVGQFYMDDGNYRGTYMRAADAVAIAADDPDAHFMLAEAARKLGKLDEAQKHYQQCLKLDPIPKEKKAAERALKEMSGGS